MTEGTIERIAKCLCAHEDGQTDEDAARAEIEHPTWEEIAEWRRDDYRFQAKAVAEMFRARIEEIKRERDAALERVKTLEATLEAGR